MPASPTIRDVAAYAGISKSTVQRVLTGTGLVSAEAHKKTMDAVAKLGYRPNPLFSMLGSQKHRHSLKPMKIAYIYRAICHAGKDYFPGVKVRGHELGYDVELVELAELAAGKRLMDILYHRGYAGVIVGKVPATDDAAILANTHLPVVCCGRISSLPLHTIQTDTTDLVRFAWSAILKAGYSRIGVALAPHVPVIEDDLDRLATVLQCQVDTLSAKDRIPPLRAPLRDYKAFITWFHKYKPDAVLAFSSSYYYPLRNSGMDMSRIGFAALNNLEPYCGFAGMIEPHESISHEAVNFLDQLIRHRSIGVPENPFHLLVPGRWVDGRSLQPKQPLPAVKSKVKAKRR